MIDMPIWLLLLSSVGVAFWLQYRVFAPLPWMRIVAECAFCSGWWSGWVVWAASWMMTGQPMFGQEPIPILLGGACWAFASATINYFFDVFVAWLEGDHVG